MPFFNPFIQQFIDQYFSFIQSQNNWIFKYLFFIFSSVFVIAFVLLGLLVIVAKKLVILLCKSIKWTYRKIKDKNHPLQNPSEMR